MVTHRKDAAKPEQIRRRHFEAYLDQASQQMKNEIEDWIKDRRVSDKGNSHTVSAVVTLPIGGPPGEFAQEAVHHFQKIAEEYRAADWKVDENRTPKGFTLQIGLTIFDTF